MYDYLFQLVNGEVTCLNTTHDGTWYIVEECVHYLLMRKSGETVHVQRHDYTYSKPAFAVFQVLERKPYVVEPAYHGYRFECKTILFEEYTKDTKKQSLYKAVNLYHDLHLASYGKDKT